MYPYKVTVLNDDYISPMCNKESSNITVKISARLSLTFSFEKSEMHSIKTNSYNYLNQLFGVVMTNSL